MVRPRPFWLAFWVMLVIWPAGTNAPSEWPRETADCTAYYHIVVCRMDLWLKDWYDTRDIPDPAPIDQGWAPPASTKETHGK